MDLKEMEALGGDVGNHWYYGSKALATERLLIRVPKQILWDIGAGDGYFSRHLIGSAETKEAYCVDTGYAQCKTEYVGKPIFFLQSPPCIA